MITDRFFVGFFFAMTSLVHKSTQLPRSDTYWSVQILFKITFWLKKKKGTQWIFNIINEKKYIQ